MATDTMITCLWFDHGEAREAAEFYASVCPDSHVGATHTAPSDFPGGEEGNELTVEFTVLGRTFVGLNGGPSFRPNEAVSFMVVTEDQARPTATGTRSSTTAARRAPAAGARIDGASPGRSRHASCSTPSTTRTPQQPNAPSTQ
jgi:predicted 3-demethylubiquinone-9 3-methyltransferase (glyoxalase superfamily)